MGITIWVLYGLNGVNGNQGRGQASGKEDGRHRIYWFEVRANKTIVATSERGENFAFNHEKVGITTWGFVCLERRGWELVEKGGKTSGKRIGEWWTLGFPSPEYIGLIFYENLVQYCLKGIQACSVFIVSWTSS